MGILFFLWRLFEFVFFGVVHGFRFLARALRRLIFRSGPGIAECMGLFITELFESLGATFVKVGQVMSTRPDVLPEEITGPLTRLQDKVAPFDVARIPGIIRQETGKDLDELFSEFDRHPVSAASVAHVHKGTLKDGRIVAVKIRRPGLLRKVKYDLLVLKIFSKFLNLFIPGMHLVALPEMIDEFGAQIYKQLDFQKEAENNRRFRENFIGNDEVRIPYLVDELCTDGLLVMEFIEGLLQVGNHEMSTQEMQRAALTAAHSFFQMIYGDGFIHADMHPGNVFFLKDGTFVLLDL
ncbi:MAG: AarF/ABC1/UbiB kinase family protein, partial [Verrucomicrobiae bacterium]|nr:AarF/ABC1/UbiB kinase family protein [Verrucomicrobiae bacterium]